MQTQKISLWQRVLAMFTALTMLVLMVPQASLPVYAEEEGIETIQLTVNVTVQDENGNPVKRATVTADRTVLGDTGDNGVYRNEGPQPFTVPERLAAIDIGVSKDGYPTQEFTVEISTGNPGENRSVSYENDSIQLKRTFEASVSGDMITVTATDGSKFFADDGIALNISEVTTAGAFTISGDNKTATAQIRSVAGKVGEQVEFKVTVNGNEVGDANGNPLKVTVPGAKLSVKNGENTVSQIEVGESATLVPVFYSLSGEEAGYSNYTYSVNPGNVVEITDNSVKAISASSSVTITVTDNTRSGGVEISTVKKSNGVLSCEKLGDNKTWQTTYTGSSQVLNKSDFKFNGQEIGDNGTFSITYKKGDEVVTAEEVKDAGTYTFTAAYSDDTYAEATLTGTIVIDKASSGAKIVGDFPESVTYGDSVSVQVSASVPGTWSGTGMVGSISAGKDETPTIQLNTSAAAENLNIVFTPDEAANYETETVKPFDVQKKALKVTVTFPSKPFDNSTAVVANTPVPKESYDANPNHTDRDAYYEVAGLTDADAAKTFAITLSVRDFAFENKGAVSGANQVQISYNGSTPVIKLNDEDSENYQVAVAANPANITRVDFSDKYSLPVDGAVPQYVDGNGITWYQGSTITVTAAAGYHIAAGTLDLNAVPFEFGNAENVALTPDTENKISFYLREDATGAISFQTVSNIRVDDEGPSIDLAKVTASNQKAEGANFDASKSSLTYTITLSDDGCGLDTENVFYAVTTDSEPVAENWKSVTPVKVENEEKDYTIRLTTPESGSTIYVKANDKVANENKSSIAHPLVIEAGSPVIDSFTVDNTDAKNNHTLTLAAHDVGTGNSPAGYSGIAKVTYTVVQTHDENGVEIEEGRRRVISNALPSVSRTDVTYENLANYQMYPTTEESATVTLGQIDDTKLNGTYSVTVTVSDFCGNSAQQTITGIIIDHIAPKATVQMGASAASDGNYYYSYDSATHAQDAKVSIQLSDTNISKGLTYTVTVDGTPLPDFENKTNSDGAEITIPAAVLGEKADGTHTLGITVTDQAGNQSAKSDVTFDGLLSVADAQIPAGMSHQASIVVDKVAPVVSLVVGSPEGTAEQKGNLVNGVWYHNAGNSQITVTVQDTNFKAMDARAVYTATVDTVTQTSVESNGVRTITLESGAVANLGDGDKTVRIVAVDAAGNEATSLAVTNAAAAQDPMAATFHLDTTAPKLNMVSSTNSYDGKLYENDSEIYYSLKAGSQIEIHYGINDQNYKTDYVQATVIKNGQELTAEQLSGAQITFNADNASNIIVTIPIQQDVAKDVYSVRITAQDKALNKLVKSAELNVKMRDRVSGADGAFTTDCKKVVDTVAPVLELDYPTGAHFYQEGAEETDYTAYYKNDFTADFSFTDAGGLDIEKMGTGELRDEAGSTQFVAQNSNVLSGDTNEKTVSYSIAQDGTYKFTAYGEDRAGNALQVKESRTIADAAEAVVTGCDANHAFTGYAKVRDTAAPAAEIRYTKVDEGDDVSHYYTMNAAGVNYDGGASYAFYNKALVVNYRFGDEYGVDPSKIYTTQNGTASVYGSAASYTDWSETSLNRDVYTIAAKTNHSNDGEYVFGVYGEDKAGNALIVTEYQTAGDDFSKRYDTGYNAENPYVSVWKKVMDTTSPAVRLEITPDSTVTNKNLQEYIPGEERYFFNGKFTATVTVTDTNYDAQRVSVRYGKQEADGDYTIQTIDNAQLNRGMPAPAINAAYTRYQYSLADQAGEGLYRFVAAGEDRAGNPTELAAVPAGEPSNFNESVADNNIGNLAGTANTFRSNYVIVDTIAPRLTVTVDDFYKAILNERKEQNGNLFTVTSNDPYQKKSAATLTLSSEDHSPVLVQYGADSTVEAQKFQFVNTDDGSTANIQKWKYYAGNQKVDEHFFNARQTMWLTHLTATDLAGNTSTAPIREGENAVTNKLYLDTDHPRFDETEPFVDLKFSKTMPSTVLGNGAHGIEGTPLTNETVVIKAEIQDPTWNSNSGANASGIYKIYYKIDVPDGDGELLGKVKHNGLTAPVAWFSGSADFGVSAAVTGTTGEITYGYGAEKNTTDTTNYKLAGKVNLEFAFDAADFNYNQITLMVWAEDNAGYVCQQNKITFAIDTTEPTILVQYDNNNARNEKYFKEDRRATVTVTERNFDEATTNILTESAASISGWTHTDNGGNGDQDTWTATVIYDKDGDYTFAVDTTDRVKFSCPDGKADYSGSIAPKEFVIDKTIPVIEVAFDNNNVANGKYYRDARVATVLITEHNFDAADAKVETTAAIAEGAVAAPGIGGWGSNGDSNTTTVNFSEDGDYTMSVDFVDKAGNEAVSVTVDEFTVDQTAPELEISINGELKDPAVDLMQAYNGEVAPSISYHDVNYRQAATSVTITGYQNTNGTNLNGHASDNEFGGSFVCDNIEAVPSNDDVYTCVGHVEDMAGNETDVEIRFSVNRFGSNYILSAQTQELIDRRYTNSRPVIEVTEINVDTLEFQEITASMNGSLVNLKEGTDYTVTESGDASTWKQYQYVIHSEVFDTDGNYDLTIHSRDAASNENSNRTSQVEEYVKPINFVLDMTAPTAVITGVENDQQYIEESRLVTVYLEDNIRLDHADIYLDDTLVASYSEETLAENSTLTYQATSKNGWQNLCVIAADKAGNVVGETSVRYLLTKNLFVQYINNTPAVVVSMVSMGGIAGLIAFLLKKKKISLLALLLRKK